MNRLPIYNPFDVAAFDEVIKKRATWAKTAAKDPRWSMYFVDYMVVHSSESEINGVVHWSPFYDPQTDATLRKQRKLDLREGYTITTMTTYSLLVARIFIWEILYAAIAWGTGGG